MTTSGKNTYLQEIVSGEPIPKGKLAYFRGRLKYRLYNLVIEKFADMEKSQGLTKAELARRIGCKPEQITRRLGAPGNWTLDTVSDLLLGIAGEELVIDSRPLLKNVKKAETHLSKISDEKITTKSSPEPAKKERDAFTAFCRYEEQTMTKYGSNYKKETSATSYYSIRKNKAENNKTIASLVG